MTTTNSSFLSTHSATVVTPSNRACISFPILDSQSEVWFASKQGDEANCAYNEISTLDIKGALDVDAVKRAWCKLAQRHQSIRARFSADGREMIVDNQHTLDWQFFDWSGLGEKDKAREQLKLMQDQACIPFDLENGPLFRVILQKDAGQHHLLTIAAHHLVLDGWSLSVLVRELGQLYNQETGSPTDTLNPAPSYQEYSKLMTDYAASEPGQRDAKFWVDQFKDAAPVLDLPIDNERPALRSYFARRHDQFLPTELVESLRKLGAKAGCSLFNTMLAAFQAYISRISGAKDFCIGIPAAGQLAMDRPGLIGHCVNMMPLRSDVDLSLTFSNQLKKTRSMVLDAMEHERYTFGKVLANIKLPRDPSRVPLMPISFNLDPMIDASSIGFAGLEVQVRVERRMFENLEWFVNGIIHADKSVELQVQYNSDLFTAENMRNLFSGFEHFIQLIIQRPESRLFELPVLTVAQQQKMLVQWNETFKDLPSDTTLHAEICKQARKAPNKIAVKFEDVKVTYEALDQTSNQIARYLQAEGVATGDLVGICVPRNANMVVAILGILKAGAGYVPLDPAFPAERLQYMCDHSQLKIVLGSHEVQALVAGFEKPTIVFEEMEEALAHYDNSPLEVKTDARSTCYVIYTSGSTGKPKGVEIPHGAVVNFLYSMADSPGFNENDSVLAVTTLSFDISVLELYLPLIVGGSTVVVGKEVASDGKKVVEAIDQYDITVFQSTPGSLRLMIAADWEGTDGLKVLCGGEPMPSDLVAPLLQRCDQLWNMFGPTETTVWSSIYQITDAHAPILIGKPIANTQIFILDEHLQPVPIGAEGEIYIGGAGVTLGYIHQPELTEQRFVGNPYYNPFVEYCNHRLYRTGDVGRFCADGNVEFLRRNDKQVKVRGFRIELGEIETAIKALPVIDQAVAIVREDKVGDVRLVAYFVGRDANDFTNGDIRDALRDVLPYYMIPQHFVELQELPQTNNGKIDYKALPVPTVGVSENDEALKPSTAVQRYIAKVWSEILELDDILINDNFFDLGGHSFLVMKSIQRIESDTGARLSPPDFLAGTLEQLAEKVNQQAEVVDSETEEEATSDVEHPTAPEFNTPVEDQMVKPIVKKEIRPWFVRENNRILGLIAHGFRRT